ncbi:MAG TPA: TetR/AcrR family transcriptional regulator [Pseudonocardia sp.]
MAARGGDVRERMVQAGLELFTERGFASVSLIQVVERASAPRGSIYHHFPGGKQQLSIEVAVSWRHTLERVVLRLGAKADSAESFLRSYIEHFRGLMASADFEAGCPMVSLSSDVGELGCEELRTAIGRTFSTIIECVTTELLRQGVDRTRAPMIAITVCSATQGALTISRATRSAAPFEQIQALIPSLLADTSGA